MTVNHPKWITELEAQSGGKVVLLVEGNIDTLILANFLTQLSAGWESQIKLQSATSKSRVIEAVKYYHPKWAGIVDTDEWPPHKVQTVLKDVPRVFALPRFCLENYFCVPEELWHLLPLIQQNVVDNNPSRLAQPILEQLPDWVAHAAMWRVIRDRRRGLLHQSGFPAKLGKSPVTDLDEIRDILTAWHNQLDPDQIIEEYEQELHRAQQLPPDEQLKQYIHGKKFFRQVVVPTLNRLFSQANADTWLQRFSQHSPQRSTLPDDLRDFLQKILSLLSGK